MPKMRILLPKRAIFNHFSTPEALVGQESPACHDFGWFCQGNHIISRANSWKTSHVNQHWHWLGALKNDMWGWFDNNFILGVGKEDFSIVGRRLLKL